MKEHAWVTIATNDKDAWKSIALAKSLRTVFTIKSILVGITSSVSEHLRIFLTNYFDAVISIDLPELKDCMENDSNEAVKSSLKIWCWKLVLFRKCIYIDPNSLVLKNPDALFDMYEEFSSFATVDKLNSELMDFGIFVLKPNLRKFKKLVGIAKEKAKSGNVKSILELGLNGWMEFKANKIDDQFYNNEFGIKDTSALPMIVHFNCDPWIKNDSNSHLNELKEKWLETFIHQIIPSIQNEQDSTQSHLWGSLQELMIPISSGGPVKPFENTDLGNLSDSIAIIGVSGRFPGANNLEELWEVLSSGTDPLCTLPNNRPKSMESWSGCDSNEAGFLKCPVDEFDAKFFEISRREATFLDPQQRILLEVVWEALEHGSINPQTLNHTNASMFLGIWQNEYERTLQTANLDMNEWFHKYLGNAFSATSSRISQFLGLFGPNVCIMSGCASSSVALHLACRSLRDSETNLAIVSGCNLNLSSINPIAGVPKAYSIFTNLRCKTFDEAADGFVRAEACAAIVLKKYSDARRDGNNILGLIRGTGLTNDGPSPSFGTPYAPSQVIAFKAALRNAGVSPLEVSFVEAHGTGTRVGDPTEMSAIREVYSSNQRKEPLFISSVKTNLGHTEACAGLVGLIKVLLSIKHSAIPPHLHLKNLNPEIDLDSIPAIIPTKLTDWHSKNKNPRIAAINSFSMCGSNVHIILQEPPESLEIIPTIQHSGLPQMIQISAKCPEALDELVKRYIVFLESNPKIKIEDFAYHTNVGRASLSHRLTVLANDVPQLLDKLERKTYVYDKIPTQRNKIGFLFTGQGSQYFGMAKTLYEKFTSFKVPLDQCDYLIQKYLGLSLKDILWGKPEYLEKSLYCQPAIFCIEYSLVKCMQSFGIEPDYVLGHSVGEFAAATTAGIISFQDAMTLVVGRSKLIDELGKGRMLAVRASYNVVLNLVKNYEEINPKHFVDVAAINSDEEVVVSGTEESIELFSKYCSGIDIKCSKIQADKAFHSRHMEPILNKFRQVVEKVQILDPKCKYVSGTLGKVLDNNEEIRSPDYWVRHLRDTVRFSDSFKLLWDECKILVEIGAQPILLGLAMGSVSDPNIGSFIPLMRKNEEDVSAMFTALSKIYLAGVTINWKQWFGRRQTKLHLPTYPFQRQKYWFDLDETENNHIHYNSSPSIHPLLGHSVPSPGSDQMFTLRLRISDFQYLNDHRIASRVIFPATAYLEIMLASAREIITRGNGIQIPIVIENLKIESALELTESQSTQIHTTLSPKQKEYQEGGTDNKIIQYNISVYKQLSPDQWKKYASGIFTPSSNIPSQTSINLDQIKNRISIEKSMDEHYDFLLKQGFDFGPNFKRIVSARIGENEALVSVTLPTNSENYLCHPAVLDSMLQAHFIFQCETVLRIPVSIGHVVWLPNEITNELYIYTHWKEEEEQEVILTNAHGKILVIMNKVDMFITSKDSFLRILNEEKSDIPKFYEEIWIPKSSLTMNQVDTSLFQIPKHTSTFVSKTKAFSMNDDELKTFKLAYSALQRIFSCFLIRGIQECGWKWPKIGEIIRPKDWLTQSSKYIQHLSLYEYFMESLVNDGYLARPNSELQEYNVLKELLSIKSCEFEIQSNLKYVFEFDEPCGFFTQRCDSYFTSVLRGDMRPLALLFPGDSKEFGALRMYNESELWRCMSDISVNLVLDTIEPLATVVQGKGGVLRILEVGAGSGASSAQLMDKLDQLNIPYHYTFTDISQVFLSEAKNKFKGQNVSYGILNIEEDPLAQGYSPESFDVILAVQVVHATRNVVESLKYLNQLLRIGGVVVLNEFFTVPYFIGFTFGFLDGWWRYNDFRQNSPVIDRETWVKCFIESGFEETKIFPVLFDTLGGIIGRKTNLTKPPQTQLQIQNHWIIISDNKNIEKNLSNKLKMFSREVTRVNYNLKISQLQINSEQKLITLNPKVPDHFVQLTQLWSNIEGVIYIWTENHEERDIQERQEIYCGGFLYLCQALNNQYKTKKLKPKINLITKGLHTIGDEKYGSVDPSTAWGLLKPLINEPQFEHYVNFFDISLEPNNIQEECEEIFIKLWDFDKEYFTCLRGSKKFVPRIIESRKKVVPLLLPNSDRFQTIMPSTNTIMDIKIANAPKPKVGENEVEVNIRACAMNFRDLLCILKPDGFEISRMGTIGFDVAGVVSSVGKNVNKLKVGDEVIGYCSGGYASHVVLDQNVLIRKPTNMTFTSASTLPVALLTVLYSFKHIAHLKPNDRILIHAATGGVGLAAIQVAKHIGAEIFATAGSNKKKSYLRSIGIQHIYHSRNTDFAEEILRDTNGDGVTFVLNTLTGPGFKEASLKACSHGAVFVELSKINIWTVEEMRALRPDLMYFIVDLAMDNPDQVFSECLSKCGDEIEKGLKENIYTGLPHTIYPLDLIHEAFYYFQETKHIGKVVVQMPLTTVKPDRKLELTYEIFNSKSSYLITGGLGGIGMEVAKWMTSSGAKTIILAGRNPPTNATQNLINQLNNEGNMLIPYQADVGDYSQCSKMLKFIKDNNLPALRGIFHGAGVLSDGTLSDQTWDKFKHTFQPKVFGGWNLHQLTLGYDLEFFINFSSGSAILGLPGQSNYAGANKYLDSLVHYRQSIGLPAQTINFGPWSDVGAVANIKIGTEGGFGLNAFTPRQGINAIQKILKEKYTQRLILSDTQWNIAKQYFKLGNYLDEVQSEQSIDNSPEIEVMVEEIWKSKHEDKHEKVEKFLESILKQILKLPVDEQFDKDQNFSELGVDSLMGMELKNNLQRLLQHKTLSINAIENNKTIRQLAEHFTKLLIPEDHLELAIVDEGAK